MTDNKTKGLHFNCDKCDHPINQPAALLFSPPVDDGFHVKKYHICIECYEKIVNEFLK
jgi:hypothetical protein